MKAAILKNTQDMILVAQIFDSGSITAACQSIGLDRSSLSRRLKELESRVGVPLFDRSGKRIQLTDIGSTYLKYCYSVRELVEEAESRITGRQLIETQILNVLADFEEAGRFLAPAVSLYSSQHANAEVVVTIVPGLQRSIPDDSDLVIQLGARQQPGVRFHELGSLARSIWAAPKLAENADFSGGPHTLKSLPCLGVSDATDGNSRWLLLNELNTVELSILPRFRLPSLVACRDACVSGLGLAILPDYLCADEHKSNRLVRVIPDWRPPALLLTAAHHRSSRTPRRTRSFIVFCKEHNFEIS
ncbi:MAG: LysR family transcriptional regulator [Gammaproteobacteria bacterium]|nr:LysR family transcriptional regulator [Gammaproteobacteria bacterium]